MLNYSNLFSYVHYKKEYSDCSKMSVIYMKNILMTKITRTISLWMLESHSIKQRVLSTSSLHIILN